MSSRRDEGQTFHEARWIVFLVVVALALRLLWLLELSSMPWADELPTDSSLYDAAARRIARGDWLLGARPLRMSPAYFYVLGLVHTIFGSGVWGIRVLQALAGAGCVPVVWQLARGMLAPRPAVLVAALVALAGPLVFFDGAILPESLSTLALLVVALAASRAVADDEGRARGPLAWGALGASIGVLSTLRPNALLLVVPAVWLALRRAGPSPRRTRALVLALAFVAVIAPITIRNRVASGSWVLLTSHGGVNLYVGNGPGATGTFRVPPEVPGGGSPTTQFEAFREAASRAEGRELDEAGSDRHWTERTLSHVASHPLDASVLVARKVHLLFNARELGLVLPYAFSRESTRTMGAPLVQSGWLAPLALVGLWIALFRRGSAATTEPRDARAHAVALMTLTFVLSVALVFVTDRYRAPLLPLLALHAVAAAGELERRAREKDVRRVGLLGLATLLAVVLAIPVRANQHFEREWVALGDGYAAMEADEQALDAYARALELAPQHPYARLGMGRVLWATGHGAEARAWLTPLVTEDGVPAAVRAEAERLLAHASAGP